MSCQLTPVAEALRLNIKKLIREKADILSKDGDGNVEYGGKELAIEVSKLIKELELGEVRTQQCQSNES
jgi:hypothetical protein